MVSILLSIKPWLASDTEKSTQPVKYREVGIPMFSTCSLFLSHAVYAFSTDSHRQNGWIALGSEPDLEHLLYCQNSPDTRLWGQGPANPQFLHF